MINVVMVRTGTKYGPEYVSILSDMLARNLSTLDVTPWCITDDPASLPEGINPIANDPTLPGWWEKCRLFSPDMPWAEGDTIAYFDLDVVITGRLEPLIEAGGIIRDWHWPSFNSSVMIWKHGEHRQIWDGFTPDMIDRPSADLAPFLPRGQVNGGDQEVIGQLAPDFPTLPVGWCVSYRTEAQGYPPDGAKVVVMHGNPKPHEITDGWVKDFWKVGGLHELPVMDGANVERDAMEANVLASSARDLRWFTGRPEHKDTAVLVCGGPSLKDSIADIRLRKRQGQTIISVNNTMAYLMANGVKPDVHVMLDARPENVAFVQDAPEGVRYLIASQCDPSVFEALAERDVVLWHSMSDTMGDVFDKVPVSPTRQLVPVPGGGTVGLRAMMLSWVSGYRKLHVYGMDGSYSGEEHHAYAQALNDGEGTLELRMGGKTYHCARWMARQAHEFRQMHDALTGYGVKVWMHGKGLLPDMAKAMRDERAAA